VQALLLHLRDEPPSVIFSSLLEGLLEVGESPMGYLAEVAADGDGDLTLRMLAVSATSWTGLEMQPAEHARMVGPPHGRSDRLPAFGREIFETSVISNAGLGPRTAGSKLEGGCDAPTSYMALPIVHRGQTVGQVGLAGRPTGYVAEIEELVGGLVDAAGQLIEAYRLERARDEATEGIKRAQEWSTTILSHLSELVTVHDSNGRITFANEERFRNIGVSGADAGNPSSLIVPEDLAPTVAAFRELSEGVRGPEEPFEFRIVAGDGSTRIFESRGNDLRSDPAVGGILVTTSDVTESRAVAAELIETAAELQVLASSLSDGALFFNDAFEIVFTNAVFCDLAGWDVDPRDLVGRSLRGLGEMISADMPDSEKGLLSTVEQILAKGVPATIEVLATRDRVVESCYQPASFDDGRMAHLWLARDVTEARDQERAREELLANETELRTSLEESNRALIEMAEMNSEFVATVSHELRTPLTSVVSFSELLLDEEENLSDEQREFLTVIRRNAERLLILVGDLLLLARIESGGYQLDLAPVDVSHLIDVVSSSMKRIASDAGIELSSSAEEGPVLMADALRIEQVLANLVSNSIKFTPPGGTITLHASAKPSGWEITVVDTGIGVPPGEQTGLFQRFYRASNARTKRTPGTGLGLVISKVIVELHGGAIELESTVNVGTTVTITLPFEREATGS
jgi:PAS domain S-box-containing protein